VSVVQPLLTTIASVMPARSVDRVSEDYSMPYAVAGPAQPISPVWPLPYQFSDSIICFQF